MRYSLLLPPINKGFEELRKVKEEIEESYLDLAESKLMKKINEGDNGSIFFYLKCKGKKRGYIENQRLELTGKGGEPIETKSTLEAGPGVSGVLQALERATSRRSDNSDEKGNKE